MKTLILALLMLMPQNPGPSLTGANPGSVAIPSPVAFYKLCGDLTCTTTSGITAPDSSGVTGSGTWQGTAAGNIAGTYYSTPSQIQTNAGNFNGSNNFIDIPDAGHVLTAIQTDFTITAWIYSPSLPSCSYGYCSIFQLGGTSWGAQLGTNTGSTLLLKTGSGTNSFTLPITAATWLFVAGERRSGDLYVFVNGTISAAVPISGNLRSYGTTDHSQIGYVSPYGPTILINNLTVYNTGLSAAQLVAACRATEGSLGVC